MLIVMVFVVAAPLLAESPIGLRPPTVVLEMLLGIVIGLQVLGVAAGKGLIGWLGKLGLALAVGATLVGAAMASVLLFLMIAGALSPGGSRPLLGREQRMERNRRRASHVAFRSF